jgi:predicted ATPase
MDRWAVSGPIESTAVFGDFELDVANAVLLRGGTPVKIQAKPLAMLVHLLRNRQRVVSKAELLAALWPGVSVSEQALWSALRDLRRALGESDSAQPTVRTLRGRGFRFTADVVNGDVLSACSERSSSAPPPADFVDRDKAMIMLRGSLGCAVRGEMRVSFVAGAAGMGKTRLASELAREARGLGFEVRVGRCLDREGALPFWPWVQVLRGLIRSERTAATARQLYAALPELWWIAAVRARPAQAPDYADLDRAEVRFRFFDAAGVFLQRVSEAHPLLICLDDLHWADEASLLLLEFAMASLHGARIHLLGAFRDPPRPEHTLSRVLAAGAREQFTERVDLRGLAREGVAVLLGHAGGKAVAPAVVDAVMASTVGNPLFVTELAKLAAHGELDVTELRRELPVPARVRDLARWQFARLSESCQRILQPLSVIGSELELAALACAVQTPRHEVLAALSEAEAVGLVVANREQTRFAFVHDLVRESIYRDLSIAARMRLHRLVAEALEAESARHVGAS